MGREAHLAWEVQAELGEGPVWVERDEALWFTDIKRQKIYRFDPATGEGRSWDAPEQVGFVFPREGGGFVAGLQNGLHRFDPEKGQFKLHRRGRARPPDNRLNDGVVDRQGRLWFGIDGQQRAREDAALSIASAGQADADQPHRHCHYQWARGLAGRDDALLGRHARGHDFGLRDRRRRSARSFAAGRPIDPRDGHPDGPTVDSEGCIWIGLYSGWEARRYSPAGELLERVRFPVSNITKIAFGGPDYRTGFATTARHLLKPEQLAQQPLAGIACSHSHAGVPGIACPAVDD